MRFLKILLLTMALLAPIAVANAATSPGHPSEASGSFTATNTVTSSHKAGENMIIESKISFTSTGTFLGTCVGTAHSVVLPNGHSTMHGVCTFTMSAGEQQATGTSVFRLQSIGEGTSFQGHFVGGHGAGALAGVHTEGSFQGTTNAEGGSTGTYSGEIHFSPS
jgi:hypothetical protein